MSISVLNLINLKKLIKFYFRYNIIRKDIYNILFLIKKKNKKNKVKICRIKFLYLNFYFKKDFRKKKKRF